MKPDKIKYKHFPKPKLIQHILVMFVFLLTLFFNTLSAQNRDSTASIYDYSLKELAELQVTTGSIKQEIRTEAPNNLIVITAQMIEERGYRTLVDVCKDIPTFDFMMYNDAGGEYPTFSMNRGIGDVGNPEILIMIDGIIQNDISFNWSLLWTFESLFADIERIEIIEGPGSVMYGAQAFTGIIHLITKKDNSAVAVKSSPGLNATFGNELFFAHSFNKDLKFTLAAHQYKSDGDGGQDRYDPGNYYSGNLFPQSILADYDSEGNFVQNTQNPEAGKTIPSGFNTEVEAYAIRSKIRYKKSEIGFFLSDNNKGKASETTPYEYLLTDPEHRSHYQSYHVYLNNILPIGTRLELSSSLVYRATNILPDGGLKYLFQFPNLTKSYAAFSRQGYAEEKLLYRISEKNTLSLGAKGTFSRKSERMVSLGAYPVSQSSVISSWDIASLGDGINQPKNYQTYWVPEAATYLLWDYKWAGAFSYSVGLRYDWGEEYGSVLNPRLAFIYKRQKHIGAKLLFGRAFRQAGVFELTSEFRGNPNLKPEKISTAELEINSLFWKEKMAFRTNVFISDVTDFIGKVPDATKPAGERYENIAGLQIAGATCALAAEIGDGWSLYSNFAYLTGIKTEQFEFYDIDRTAKYKTNIGINTKFLRKRFTSDFRINYVGKRKAPETNTWLQTYENGYAPSYLTATWAVSFHFAHYFTVQLLVDNLFDTDYYGVGRETGSGFIDDYDSASNINPDGHIPAYHPQPGRNFSLNIKFRL